MRRKKLATAAVTVLTVALCVTLCASTLKLYANGAADRAASGSAAADIFTREAVGRQLLRMSPVAILWLAAVLTAVFTGVPAGDPSEGAPDGASVRELFLPEQSDPRRGVRRRRMRIALYLAAAVLVILGVLNGGMNDVLVKAIHICTECIGLG